MDVSGEMGTERGACFPRWKIVSPLVGFVGICTLLVSIIHSGTPQHQAPKSGQPQVTKLFQEGPCSFTSCPSPALAFPFGKLPLFVAEKAGSTVLLVGTFHSQTPRWFAELQEEIELMAPFTQIFTENDHGKLLAAAPLVLDAIDAAIQNSSMGEATPSSKLRESYGLDEMRGVGNPSTDNGTASALSAYETLGELRVAMAVTTHDANSDGVDANVLRQAIQLSPHIALGSPDVLESGFVSNCYMRPAAKEKDFCSHVGARGRNESEQQTKASELCKACFSNQSKGAPCMTSLVKSIEDSYVSGDYEHFAETIVAGLLLSGFLEERNRAWAKVVIDAAPVRALVAVGAAHLVDIPGQATSMLHPFVQAGYSVRAIDVLSAYPNFRTQVPSTSTTTTSTTRRSLPATTTIKAFACVSRTNSSTVLPYCEECCGATTCNPSAAFKKFWKQSRCDDCLAKNPGCET